MASKIMTSFPENSNCEGTRTYRVSAKQVDKIIKNETIHVIASSILSLKILYDFHNVYLGQSFLTSIALYICYQRYTLCNQIKKSKDNKSQNMPSKNHYFIEKNHIDAMSKLESKITPIVIGILMINTLYLINGFPELRQTLYALSNLGLIAKLFFYKLPDLSPKDSALTAVQAQDRFIQNPKPDSDSNSIFFNSNPRADSQKVHTQNTDLKKKIDPSTPFSQNAQTNVCSNSEKPQPNNLLKDDSAIGSSNKDSDHDSEGQSTHTDSTQGAPPNQDTQPIAAHHSANHVPIPSPHPDSTQGAPSNQDTQPIAAHHSANHVPTPSPHTDPIQAAPPNQDTQPIAAHHSANHVPTPSPHSDSTQAAPPNQDTQPIAAHHSANHVPTPSPHSDPTQASPPNQDTQPIAAHHSANHVPTPSPHSDPTQAAPPNQDTQPIAAHHSANHVPPPPFPHAHWQPNSQTSDNTAELNPPPVSTSQNTTNGSRFIPNVDELEKAKNFLRSSQHSLNQTKEKAPLNPEVQKIIDRRNAMKFSSDSNDSSGESDSNDSWEEFDSNNNWKLHDPNNILIHGRA